MLSKESDINVVGMAHNGEEAVQKCETIHPDIILMDIQMPIMGGVQATRLIKRKNAHIPIIMLTTFQDKQNIQMALQAGADGYLLKTDKITDIAHKLRMIMNGTSVLDHAVLKKLTTPDIPASVHLTPRELEILQLVSQGLTNKEIAEQLFLSEGRVRNVVSIIMEKMNVKNQTQLAREGQSQSGKGHP